MFLISFCLGNSALPFGHRLNDDTEFLGECPDCVISLPRRSLRMSAPDFLQSIFITTNQYYYLTLKI